MYVGMSGTGCKELCRPPDKEASVPRQQNRSADKQFARSGVDDGTIAVTLDREDFR